MFLTLLYLPKESKEHLERLTIPNMSSILDLDRHIHKQTIFGGVTLKIVHYFGKVGLEVATNMIAPRAFFPLNL